MDNHLTVCGKEYRLIRLLGHGKGETVEAKVPSGILKFKILDIKF